MGRKHTDLSGMVFGNMRIVKESPVKNAKGKLWICSCVCGDYVSVMGYDLTRGRSNFCKRCNAVKSKMSPLKTLYGNYKRAAIKRGHAFDLTIQQVWELTQQPCYYCGDYPNQILHKKGAKEGLRYNGIDRQDNSQGYYIGNCVSCCKFCNFAKSKFKLEDFLFWLKRVRR